MNLLVRDELVEVDTGSVRLEGNLNVPDDASGVVLFAHGSGSSRHSPRNRYVAETLQQHGLGTLLIDLLTTEEERLDRQNGHLRFDIPMLATRLEGAVKWLHDHNETARLAVGLFGASTGAAAALITAAELPDRVKAVVSRGGRPDLADERLADVQAPTLLIVGGRDHPVVELNEEAAEQLTGRKVVEIIPKAGHLFEEEGALEQVASLAADWFVDHFGAPSKPGGGTNGRHRDHQTTVASLNLDGKPSLIARKAERFRDIDSSDVDGLLERVGDARVVLLGEATHGTSEFYRMRQRITKALITRRGFNIIAVEADWPDAERLDEYVRGRDRTTERRSNAFSDFPSWMWRNQEVYDFMEWLRDYNEQVVHQNQKTGVYGLDLYSLYASVDQVLEYLEAMNSELAEVARQRYECLSPFRSDPSRYGSAVVANGYRECQDDVTDMLTDLLRNRLELSAKDGEAFLDAAQNARVVANAERYYKLMYLGAPDSWNLRDSHMFETLQNILSFRGETSKAVVWAHNSHIGNAGATEMSKRGETNIGQLVHETFREDAYAIGFGTHAGTVAAAGAWGGPVEFKKLRPSHRESYEHVCHSSGVPRFILPLRDAEVRSALIQPKLERAVGVIYRPETERQSHYFEAVLPDQFDEYVWFNESTAVRPLERARAPSIPDRHPFLLGD